MTPPTRHQRRRRIPAGPRRAAAEPAEPAQPTGMGGGGRAPGAVPAAAAAAVTLLALLVGLPVLLWRVGGLPLPVPPFGAPPSLAELADLLRAPDSGRLLLRGLLLTAWAGWAAFTASVLVEAAAQARGHYSPHLPGLGPVQQLAGGLVAALAVGVAAPTLQLTAATTTATVAGPAGAPPASAGTAPRSAAPTSLGGCARPEPPGGGTEAAERPEPARPEQRPGRPVYVVQPPRDGHRDSLWSIAARHLGDPLRWREIAALNHDRPQPDGRRLTDPHWIYPGWRLLLPLDATGLHDAGGAVDRGGATAAPPAAGPTGTSPRASATPTTPPGSRPVPSPPNPSRAVPRTGQPAPSATARAAAPAPAPGSAPVSTRPAAPPDPTGSGRGHRPGDRGGAAPAPTTPAAGNMGDDPGDPAPLLVALAGAGLLAAGATAALARLRALQRRRRRTGAPMPRPAPALLAAESRLRVLAEPDHRRFLDLALRSLSHQLGAHGQRPSRALPEIAGARLTPTRLELHLLADGPDRTGGGPPEPFTATGDGRVWTLDHTAPLPLTPATAGTVLAPYPALVPLGHDNAGLVLLDLEAFGGVALTGAPGAALAALRWVAAELALSGWADDLHATLVGFGAELTGLNPERLTHLDSLTDALLTALEDRAAAEEPPGGVLAARQDGSGDPCSPEILLLAAPPTGAHAEQLRRLLRATRRTGVAVLAAGDLPGARTTVHVGGDGLVRVDALGITVRSNRIDGPAAAAIADLLRAARLDAAPGPQPGAGHSQPPDRAGPAAPPAAPPAAQPAAPLRHAGRQPAARPAEPAGHTDHPPPGHPHHPEDLDHAVTAYLDRTDRGVVRVGVMGPVRVDADGPVDRNRVPVCTELVTYLASRGGRLDSLTELDIALWPDRAVQLSTRTEAVARARRWLGTAPDGTPHLSPGRGGQLRLGPGVLLDWDLFQRLTTRAHPAGPTTARDLATALRLVRGKPFEAVPAGRYRWLAETYLEQDIPAAVVDAAHRLARIQLDAGDPAAARDAARTAQLVDRYDERPWRDLLEAEDALGNRGQVRLLVDDMLTMLEVDLDDDLTDDTRALLDRLHPHRPRTPRRRGA